MGSKSATGEPNYLLENGSRRHVEKTKKRKEKENKHHKSTQNK